MPKKGKPDGNLRFSIDGGRTWHSAEGLAVAKPLSGPRRRRGEITFLFKKDEVATLAWVDNVCSGSRTETYREIGDELV